MLLEGLSDSVLSAAPNYIFGLPSAALLRVPAPGLLISVGISDSAILTFRIMAANSGFRPM